MTQQITDIQDQGVDLLLSQFKDKTNFEKMIRSILAPVQTLHNDIWTIKNGLSSLDVLAGDLMDKVGGWVGVSRGGRLDQEYLQSIKLQICINSSRGTIDDIADAVNIVTGATRTHIVEHDCVIALTVNINLDSAISVLTIPFGYYPNLGGGGYGVGAYASYIGGSLFANLQSQLDRVLAGGVRIETIAYYESEPFEYGMTGYGSGGYSTLLN